GPLQPRCQVTDLEPFASQKNGPQRAEFSTLSRHEFRRDGLECGWRLVQDCNLMAAYQIGERSRRLTHSVRHDDDSSSKKKRPPQFPKGEVERQGVEPSPDVVRAELIKRCRCSE